MAYYDNIAAGYNELYKEEQLNKLLIIKNNIDINKNTKILDLGCGTGISSGFDCFVVGIDPSIELLKQNSNNKKLSSNAELLPFKDNSFDCIVSVTAFHNFKNIKKAIDEAKRVGKEKFVFSILKKSRKFDYIKNLVERNFKIEKIIEEEKDMIWFCDKHGKQ